MSSLIDRDQIGLDLEKFSEVFYHFWNFVNIQETDQIPTAAVSFDKKGNCIVLSINPEFWATKNYSQKLFVICHEMLHIALKHGLKSLNLIKGDRRSELKIANVAMDLCVNRILTTSFGFNRAEIDPNSEYCWVETVFKTLTPQPSPDKYFEYYFNLLKDNAIKVNINIVSGDGKGEGGGLVDSHEGLSSFDDEALNDILREIADKTHNENAKDFIDKIKNANDKNDGKSSGKGGRQAGNEAGCDFLKLKAEYIPKRKWEAVIRDWVKMKLAYGDDDQWARKSRRMGLMDFDKVFLPSENDNNGLEEDRITVSLYLDTSGSCAHLAERFFAISNTIPLDKFEVKLYCFDTQVFRVENGELKGFGGTSFNCIESSIQNEIKNGDKYPESVWIITDGMGDHVTPQYPDKWNFFLSENIKTYIPIGANTFMLGDFE